MIIVLFGPPGVGKTYVGRLLETKLGWHFFDADTIYFNDDELRYLLKMGKYTQQARDKFVNKLMIAAQHMVAGHPERNLVIAEAFTKEKNREEFLKYFDDQVHYVMVHASRDLAYQRTLARMEKEDHVVDQSIFEFIWDEFETPKIPHKVLRNYDKSDSEIIDELQSLIE